jgi:hypothetical protein
MTEREAIEMMARCSAEIKGLRADIERLRPKAEAYDNLAIVLNGLVPQPSRGMGEDLAWTLDKRIREVSEKYKSPKMEQAA